MSSRVRSTWSDFLGKERRKRGGRGMGQRADGEGGLSVFIFSVANSHNIMT